VVTVRWRGKTPS